MRRLRFVGIIIGVLLVLGVTGCLPSRTVGRAADEVADGTTELTTATEANPGLVADYTVLLQVRDTLAGSTTLNWSTDRPIVDWDGVAIGGSPPRVIALHLSHHKLTGTIPPQLGALTQLESLSLRVNQLSGPIPPELGALASLEWLSLSNNQLSGTIPPELDALANLEVLELYDNQLSGPIPPELGALASLEWLWLDNNQLSGPIPPELGALANLEWLVLSNNQLSGSIPPELAALSNLERLFLGNNQLSGTIPPELGTLASLWRVALSGNAITGCIPSDLLLAKNDLDELGLPICAVEAATGEPTTPCANGIVIPNPQAHSALVSDCTVLLQIRDTLAGSATLNWHVDRLISDWDGVTVSGSPRRVIALAPERSSMTGIIPPQLAELTHLERLVLFGHQLSGPIPPQLGALANLEVLELVHNQLSGSIPPELGALTQLRRLDLSENRLSGSIPSELRALADLEWLWLGYNQLSGSIPPELAALSNLVKLYLANGNAFTGCLPEGLRRVGTNDFAELGLPFCGA